MWFVGFDLIAHFRSDESRLEEVAIKRLLQGDNAGFRDIRNKLEPVLNEHFEYYKHLPEPLKLKFLLRTSVWMKRKRFSGREGLVVTEEMKMLISASAIQLTFGLSDFQLNHFSEIVIYPDVFLSTATNNLHRGETSMKGYIVLSWKHFLEGYKFSSDKLNLGLHELAHALDLSRIVKSTDPFFHAYFVKWMAASNTEFNAVNEEEQHFLRNYAGTNQREFFAVCVEHFFEDPYGFKERLPVLYRHLSVLLRQDPVAISNNSTAQVQWISNVPDKSKLTEAYYRSSLGIWYAIKGVVVPLGCYFFLSAMNSGADLSVASVLFSVIIAVGVINFVNRLRVLEVMDGFVVIKSLLFNSYRKSYAFGNIISIRYFPTRNGTLAVTVVEEGTIITLNPKVSLERSEYVKLQETLANKDIMMSF